VAGDGQAGQVNATFHDRFSCRTGRGAPPGSARPLSPRVAPFLLAALNSAGAGLVRPVCASLSRCRAWRGAAEHLWRLAVRGLPGAPLSWRICLSRRIGAMIIALFLHLSRILHDNPVSSRICGLIDDGEQGGVRKLAGIAVPGRAARRDAPNGANVKCRDSRTALSAPASPRAALPGLPRTRARLSIRH
jgi:hypothetical protein